MATIEEVNEDFNVKKPKKKGLIFAIIAVLLVIAFILVYCLVISKPQFIFSRAINNIFKYEDENYDSIKINSNMNVSVKAEDTSIQQQLNEIEKYNLKLGTQLDIEKEQEIIDLGLEYDNSPVIDAQIYYDGEELYAFLEGLFDKYIKLEMNEEQKESLQSIFETSNKDVDTKFFDALKNELKSEIKERGTYEREKITVEISGQEQKVIKNTYSLNSKDIYKIMENIVRNLGENDKLIENIEQSKRSEFKDEMNQIADSIEETNVDEDLDFDISILTKGILNKTAGVEIEVYSKDDKSTVLIDVLNEDENIYSFNIKVKADGVTEEVLNGNVEIKKDKDSKNEQAGKVIITVEVPETAEATLTIDYIVEFNKGIDNIDVSNNINMSDITEQDIQGILEKLRERHFIGDIVRNLMDLNVSTVRDKEGNVIDTIDDDIQLDNNMLVDPYYITDVPNAQ